MNITYYKERFMGAKDLSPRDKTQQNPVLPDEDLIEREGYGKSSYKRIQKLRKKGLNYGINVPKCTQPLIRPEKPRKLMITAMCAYIATALLLLVGTIIMYIKMNYFTAVCDMIKVLQGTLKPENVAMSLGFSGFATISTFLLIVVLLLLAIAPIAIAIALCIRIKSIYELANAPRQEIAVGYRIKNMILRIAVIAVADIAVLVFMLAENILGDKGGLWPVLIMLTIFVVLVLYDVALIISRKKEKQWYDTLPAEAREDYEAHNNALAKLDSRRRGSSVNRF